MTEKFPFAKLPHAYTRQGLLREGGATKFAVYGAHLSVAPGDWTEYNLYISKIMDLTGLSESSVKKANAWLKKMQVIDSASRIYKSGQKANEWQLLPPCMWVHGGHVSENIPSVDTETPPGCTDIHAPNSNNNSSVTRTFKTTTTVEVEIPANIDPVVVALLKEFDIGKGKWPEYSQLPLTRLQEAALYTRKNAKQNPGGLFCKFIDEEWKSKSDKNEWWLGECDRVRASYSHLQSKGTNIAYPITKQEKGPLITLDTNDGPYKIKDEDDFLKFLGINLPNEEKNKVVDLSSGHFDPS